MTRIRTAFIVGVIAAVFFSPSALYASDATDQLGATVERVLPIINHTPRAQLMAEGLPENARKLILARFDFAEMTKRSLGQHWGKLSRTEQKQFIDAFTQWQLKSLGKLVVSSRAREIQFTREIHNGKEVKVETRMIGEYAGDLPIEYWLHNQKGQWKVHNIVIDNIDNVQNIRAQFDRVIAKSSLNQLLQKIKDQSAVA